MKKAIVAFKQRILKPHCSLSEKKKLKLFGKMGTKKSDLNKHANILKLQLMRQNLRQRVESN